MFLWLSVVLLGFEVAAYFKGWHFGTPHLELEYLWKAPFGVKDVFDSLYSKWVLIRVEYLAPPLQFLANVCIVLFLIQTLDRLVLCLGCFWIKFKKIKPVPSVGALDLESGETGYFPMVLIQIPMCNEKEVYQQSIAAVCNLDWPKANLLIQVLDDSDDPTTQMLIREEVHKWQRDGARIEYRHRVIREGYKAGNLKSAMNCSYVKDYEFVAIFDADFQPTSDFLKRTVPHFKDNEELGLVQARWSFVNKDENLLTRLQNINLAFHFEVEQQVNGVFLNFFGFNGTAGVWRIKALEDAGGWLERTTVEDMAMRISSVDIGITIIKQRLSQKRVLIVLDDVDHIDQVNALARQRDWFGSGSRIIITTRNKQLLKALKVEQVYMAENNSLDEDESLELFSWNAFQEPYPPPEFLEYSKIIVSYCGSLPLALEVLGSSVLCGREIPEWKSAIEKLKRIPHTDIQKKLRLSYDALNDETERDIFLDVCCFLVGMEREKAVKILDGCGFYGGIGLGVLISRCLVKVDIIYNKLMMHDLLRDMGREIVRESCPKEFGKRSRLWHQDEVYKVLTDNMGTENIEGLALELPRANKEKLNAESFGKMQNLRLLKLNYVHLIGNFEHLISKDLRWVCWHGFPLNSIPTNFYQGNLVVIDMRHSCLTEAWRDSKCLGNLKVLNLSHSHKLKKSPDFSKLPNLEELKLKNCTSLSELHQSIGQLGRLYLIKMQGCINLKNLPMNIYKLKSLQTLNIVCCSKIERLHEELGELESLTTLLADQTAITQIPCSIVRLKKLRDLSLCGCKRNSLPSHFLSWIMPSYRNPKSSSFLPVSLHGLSSLTVLNLGNCNLDAIPEDLGTLSSLENLNLKGNNFQFLEVKFSGLTKLKDLSVNKCKRLEFIREFPRNLLRFSATNCKSLEWIPDVSNFQMVPTFVLTNCEKLVEVSGLDKLDCSTNIRMAGCSNLSTQFRMNLLKKWSGYGFGSICIPGSEISESFDFFSSEPSLSFQIPNNRILRGLTVFVVYTFDSKYDSRLEAPSIKVINKTKGRSKGYTIMGLHRVSTIHGDHTWLIPLPSSYGYVLEAQDSVELHISTEDSSRVVKKCGVRLIYYEHDDDDRCNDEESEVAGAEVEKREVRSDVGCRNLFSNDYSQDGKFRERRGASSRVSYFIISILVLVLSVTMINWFF